MRATWTSRFPEITASMRPRVSKASKRGAEKVAEQARINLAAGGHNRTGDLINKIEVRNAGGPASWRVVAGDSHAFYGHLVEGGTDVAPAYPFLMPAFESEQHEVAAEIQIVLKTL